ncbi:lysosomal acid lipase [Acrasis kona]|uniref:Lysosomal acid lipase n=1 Tax=Acrasis kona TaxID=1008807 RepID=A0AAW2YWI5_9EUKA
MVHRVIAEVIILLVCLNVCVSAEDNKIHVPRTTLQLIKEQGFPSETHKLTTSDGYILTIFRIPHGRTNKNDGKRRAVMLQHGLLDCSNTWVNNMYNESLAFILADQGYDVWLGNVRGNRYSDEHVSLSKFGNGYWQFTYDEMALIDLPTMIEYILKASDNERLHAYIGHSQGCVMGFACFSTGNCSTTKTFNVGDKVDTYVAMAPAAFVGNVAVPFFKVLASSKLPVILEKLGVKSFLPSTALLRWLLPNACTGPIPELQSRICWSLICIIMGCDTMVDNVNFERMGY